MLHQIRKMIGMALGIVRHVNKIIKIAEHVIKTVSLDLVNIVIMNPY